MPHSYSAPITTMLPWHVHGRRLKTCSPLSRRTATRTERWSSCRRLHCQAQERSFQIQSVLDTREDMPCLNTERFNSQHNINISHLVHAHIVIRALTSRAHARADSTRTCRQRTHVPTAHPRADSTPTCRQHTHVPTAHPRADSTPMCRQHTHVPTGHPRADSTPTGRQHTYVPTAHPHASK